MSTILQAGNATSGAVLSSDTAGTLQIQTGSTPTTAITVDASQNVGIGTTSPYSFSSYKVLDIRGTSGGWLNMGTSGTSSFYMYTDGTNTGINTIPAGYLAFGTTNTERMRIDSSGNLLVGTTSSTPTGTNNSIIIRPGAPSYFSASNTNSASFNRYTTSGTIVNLDYAGSTVGTIATNGSNCTFNSVSDYRLKEDVKPMTGALDKISQLKPCTYIWKATGEQSEGFIAHELQAVVPDCVTGEKDAVDAEGKPIYQGIDTSFLVATLTAAIQELKAEIDELKAKVAA